jgi:hypothetical protein
MKVTKWSIFNGELTVSDQEAEKIDGETGSLSVSHSAETPSEPVTASAIEAAVVKDTPAPEGAASEPIAPEPSMSEPTLSEALRIEAKPESRPEAAPEKPSHTPARVIVMPRGERAWSDRDVHIEAGEAAAHQGLSGKRRISAIAAVVALAAAAGALGGAYATASFMHGSNDVAVNGDQAGGHTSLEASLSRLDSEIQTLKAGLDHTSKVGMNQFNKTTDRLDKLERAQAEPAARLAKLSDAVDRLRAAPAVAAASAASAAAKETTGSIGPAPAQQQAAASKTEAKIEAKPEAKPDGKTEVGRLPTVEGWVLRDVAYGSALIDSRRGTYEVYAGDMIPGLGRVDAIRRQDGRWVVVTSRGLIVAR